MARIPVESIQLFLARPDVPIGMREFFGDRGIFPDEIPQLELEDATEADRPLIDIEEVTSPDDAEEGHESAVQKLARMGFTERLTEQEVEAFSRMASVSEDVLRTISHNRAWMKKYNIVVGLTKNPKTPLGTSLNLISRLNDRDLIQLSVDRNVPEPLRVAARKRVVGSATGRR
jgi:hypothetical protein